VGPYSSPISGLDNTKSAVALLQAIARVQIARLAATQHASA
jgi:hypothetical protein